MVTYRELAFGPFQDAWKFLAVQHLKILLHTAFRTGIWGCYTTCPGKITYWETQLKISQVLIGHLLEQVLFFWDLFYTI